jgi:hypothetical protein
VYLPHLQRDHEARRVNDASAARQAEGEEMGRELPATWNAGPTILIIGVFHVAANCGMILAWTTACAPRRP